MRHGRPNESAYKGLKAQQWNMVLTDAALVALQELFRDMTSTAG